MSQQTVLIWYRVLRMRCQLPIFQAILFALRLSR
jgi:hypothetical protein